MKQSLPVEMFETCLYMKKLPRRPQERTGKLKLPSHLEGEGWDEGFVGEGFIPSRRRA
jgi:hypothetical protein